MTRIHQILGLGLLLVVTSGCAISRDLVSRGDTRGDHVRLKAIDARTQADACRRTAVELASREKDEHAIAQFERARQLDPKISGIAHPLAVLLDRQGRMDAAEREYQRALKESPRNADLFNDYGYFLYNRGDLAEAEHMLERSLELSPTHPKAALNLGMVLARRSDFDGAFRQFEAAVGPAAAHHNVGMLLMKQGREAEAVTHFEQAIQRDPSLTQSSEILAELDNRQSAPWNDIQQASAESAEPQSAEHAE